MPKSNSTRKQVSSKPKKPAKPFADFPLWAHPSGRWCKKVAGKMYYFGKWDDAQGALDEWEADRADILAGRRRTSRQGKATDDGKTTLRDLTNRFLTAKKNLLDVGELSPHTFNDYHRTATDLIEGLGRDTLLADLKPHDFERLRAIWAKRSGAVRLKNEINRAKVFFNYAYKNDLIDRPVRYGTGFDKPSAKTIEVARHKKGKRLFEADELRRLIEESPQPLRSMFLLGINCAFGNGDVARIRLENINLQTGWVDYGREKTGIMRRCPLWPETVESLRQWLAMRPTPANEAEKDLLFLRHKGQGWITETANNRVASETRRQLDRLGIVGPNKDFYALRHSFATVAGGSRDQVAVNAVMGHRDVSMAARYREHIDDDRLQAVVAHVRSWLFGTTQPKEGVA